MDDFEADAVPVATVYDVRRRLAEIEVAANKPDPEDAHWKQDRLWADVLIAVADGVEDASAIAREALQAQQIQFARWYS